jgi:hypothetical protein
MGLAIKMLRCLKMEFRIQAMYRVPALYQFISPDLGGISVQNFAVLRVLFPNPNKKKLISFYYTLSYIYTFFHLV